VATRRRATDVVAGRLRAAASSGLGGRQALTWVAQCECRCRVQPRSMTGSPPWPAASPQIAIVAV